MPRSPLFEHFNAELARMMDYHGWEIPASFSSIEAEYWALKQGVGLADLSHRGRLLVRGEDAPRFLHGMVSNEVKGLEAGQGSYNFLLDPHGHILADARIFRLATESFLLDCEPQLLEVIRQALDHHIIADAVELEDASAQLACLALKGPRAREVLREVVGFDPPQLDPLDHVYLDNVSARLIHTSACGGEGYWILTPPEGAGALWQKAVSPSRACPERSRRDREGAVLEAGLGCGLRPVGFDALEIRRIEAGVPRYGQDMDTKTLPQETGQMQAISFTKGCYIGQETVERIRSRGHVNRQLVGLLFEGKRNIARDMMVLAAGHPVGFITSATFSFGLCRTIALAYLRRESAQPGASVMVESDVAEVAALPFALSSKSDA